MIDRRDNGPLPREIAVHMIPVIRRIARRLARRLPPHICLEDLVSAGFLGLVTAYRRFDAERGEDFCAYAELRIHGAMIDELRAADPLSRDLRAHSNREAIATRVLESRLGRAPEAAEIARELGLDVDSYRSYSSRAALGATVSLDAGADGASIQLADPASLPADEQLEAAQIKRDVRFALEALPPRLRRVVELYYGDELTLRDIGAVLGVTESRVCQLQAEAMRRMRAHCERHDAVRRRSAAARQGLSPAAA